MASSSSSGSESASTRTKKVPFDFGICYPVTEFKHDVIPDEAPNWYDKNTKTWRPYNETGENDETAWVKDWKNEGFVHDCYYKERIEEGDLKYNKLDIHKNKNVRLSYNMPLSYRNFLLKDVAKGFENMPSARDKYGNDYYGNPVDYRYFSDEIFHYAHRMALRAWVICEEKKIADQYVGMPSTLPDEVFSLIMAFSDFYDSFLMIPEFGVPWPPNGMWPIESARREVEDRGTHYELYDNNMFPRYQTFKFSEEYKKRSADTKLKKCKAERRAKREKKRQGLEPIYDKRSDQKEYEKTVKGLLEKSSAFKDFYAKLGKKEHDGDEKDEVETFTYTNSLTGIETKEAPPEHMIKEDRIKRLMKKHETSNQQDPWFREEHPVVLAETLEALYYLTSDDDSTVGDFEPMEVWSPKFHRERDEFRKRHYAPRIFINAKTIPDGGSNNNDAKYWFDDYMDVEENGYDVAAESAMMNMASGNDEEFNDLSPSVKLEDLPIYKIHPNKRYYRYIPEICIDEQLSLVEIYNEKARAKGITSIYDGLLQQDFLDGGVVIPTNTKRQKRFFCFICGETHQML